MDYPLTMTLLWMFGEDAQSCNWNHPPQNDSQHDTTDTRYSIIFDLQGRT